MEPIANTNKTQKLGIQKSIRFNPYDPKFQANPYPFYHNLRLVEPIHQSFTGMWVITRYADAKAVLRDSRFCVNKMQKNVKQKSHSLEQRDFNTLAQAIDKWLIYLDPPEHTRLRGLISKAFSSTSVNFLRPQIQKITDELISKVRHKGFMDIISEFACPLPCNVIAAILGIPVEDWLQLYHWSDKLSNILDPLSSLEDYEQMNTVALEFTNYFKSLIAQRQKSPQQDLLSALITVKEQNNKLSEDEIISVCMLLFLTGEETTVNLIGNGMLALLSHPEQMQQIKTQPMLIQSAVEEILRYDSPIQITTRVATEDIVIDDVTVRCGEKVLVVLGAANRDPAQFPEPDCFDITRVNNNHLAFADGIHYCLGAALTRIEAEIAINTLIQQLPDLKLSQDQPEWRNKVAFRSLKALPVTFTPAVPV
ncbi:cytochrome P450 [Nostoc sp. CENA67]|uniref:Cytochrome P450 n=1 Tax=Amazonocrinis nigriterrae CENA67 TaxID=2794033 RepID=A0A8J7HPU5_9NOST|nr:cytochrome P450 [Amazonocrinis nigriterrae]MBH8563713.1 cytochrome P450 [Amazonocrinis nigriterrae CENA67]